MELAGVPTDDRNAGYIDEDESDIEYSDFDEADWEVDSSDEEGRWQYLHERLSGVSGNEEDVDFEKCMDDELTLALDAYVKGFHETNKDQSAKSTSDALSTADTEVVQEARTGKETEAISKTPSTSSKDKKEEFYDDIYFSSASSENISDEGDGDREKKKKQKKSKRRKLTNDELLYDPNMDKEDERWINRQRMAYRNVHISQKLESQTKQSKKSGGAIASSNAPGTSGSGQKESTCTPKPPKSDAILSCPACISTLCIDCQRHVFYKNQYRAMFVLNCTILRDQVLHIKPSKKGQKQRKKKKIQSEPEEEDDSGPYHPVQCTICNTEVAVYDNNEIFHFFNVLPSAS